jgi:hypothetical protein
MENSYTNKLVTKMLNQTTCDFYNIWVIITQCYIMLLIFKYKQINLLN